MPATTFVPLVGPYRQLVTDLLAERCTPAVYGYLPDDVAHLPCLVVGRVSMREANVPAVMRMSLDVTLLGRRVADEDAQRELDVYLDELFAILGGTRGVKVNDNHIACRGVVPAQVAVAGDTFPAYIATVTMDALSC